jgi:hypothetical protein
LNCEIKGTFVGSINYKYAYLVDLELKSIIKTVITGGKFKFILAKPESYQTTQLFFEEDSIKTVTYFLEQSKRASVNRRIVAIENADLIFVKNALDMKVTSGQLNEDINQMYKVMETRDFQTFFDQHPDSEISLSLLKALIRLNKIFENSFDCKAFYDKLSERIKNSQKGKELFLEL